MDYVDVLGRLAVDRPQFHSITEDGARRVALAGMTVATGDHSWAVGQGVLRWIAEHLSDDMVTIETGAGYTTVLFAARAKHHYCCTPSESEITRIGAYLDRIGVPREKVTFVMGSTDETLPELQRDIRLDFAYIDGCHGYPFPALDWHYIDRHLKPGAILGMDNAELRPVREHCDFLEENGTYTLADIVIESCFARFYRKLSDQPREWIDQPFSRAKRDPCDWSLRTRIRRKGTKWIKPYLY